MLRDDGVKIAEDSYLLSSLIRACKFKNHNIRTRLPIQKSLLIEILKFTKDYYLEQGQLYLATLFKALFTTAYFGLFQVCELTMTASQHAVRVADVHIGKNKKKFLFILRSSKTHQRSMKPQMIKILMVGEGNESKHGHSLTAKSKGWFCPYSVLKQFAMIRPKYHDPNEQFFIFRDYTPVMALHMRSTLHLMLKIMQYNETLFNCHSFRSGRSSDLLKYGLSMETIKQLGHWESSIIYAYLK